MRIPSVSVKVVLISSESSNESSLRLLLQLRLLSMLRSIKSPGLFSRRMKSLLMPTMEGKDQLHTSSYLRDREYLLRMLKTITSSA